MEKVKQNMKNAKKIKMEIMRPSEITAERNRCPLIYLPIGPLEWHGPHLPLGVDPIHAEETAVWFARKTGELIHHIRGMVSVNEFKDIMGWDKF